MYGLYPLYPLYLCLAGLCVGWRLSAFSAASTSGSVAPAEALVPASPPHNQPLYTVLYCAVQYTHIVFYYVQLLLKVTS